MMYRDEANNKICETCGQPLSIDDNFTADFMDKDKPKGAVETGDESLDSHFKGK